MAIPTVPSVSPGGAAGGVSGPKESFAKAVAETTRPRDGAAASSGAPTIQGPPREVSPVAKAGRQQAVACPEPVGKTTAVSPGSAVSRAEASRVADRVLAAQQKLDKLLELAQSGKTFTTAELLAMQAHVYSASQEIDLAGKVVEKATSGLKTLLQTQL